MSMIYRVAIWYTCLAGMIYGWRHMIYFRCAKKWMLSVPLHTRSVYHRTKCDIISKIYHPFRKERITQKSTCFCKCFFLMGWAMGFFLSLAKHFGFYLLLCFAKSFGHRSKRLPRSLFSLLRIPFYIHTKKENHHPYGWWFSFYGVGNGIRTHGLQGHNLAL